MNNKSKLLSHLVVYGAMALIVATICAAAFNPQIPIWLAVLVGIAIGAPLLVIGFRLHPGPSPDSSIGTSGLPSRDVDASKQFWLSRTEMWGVIGLLTFLASISVPLLLFLPLFLLLPAGDNWTNVILRIVSVTVIICVSSWWIGFARKNLPTLFRGKLAESTIDSFVALQSPKEPGSTKEAVLINWQLLVIVAIAFLVVSGVINLKNLALQPNVGPRHFRGWVHILIWCRGNPNTVTTSLALVGIGALALFVYRVVRTYFILNRVHAVEARNNPMGVRTGDDLNTSE